MMTTAYVKAQKYENDQFDSLPYRYKTCVNIKSLVSLTEKSKDNKAYSTVFDRESRTKS